MELGTASYSDLDLEYSRTYVVIFVTLLSRSDRQDTQGLIEMQYTNVYEACRKPYSIAFKQDRRSTELHYYSALVCGPEHR
jgi:hypothetical protein